MNLLWSIKKRFFDSRSEMILDRENFSYSFDIYIRNITSTSNFCFTNKNTRLAANNHRLINYTRLNWLCTRSS